MVRKQWFLAGFLILLAGCGKIRPWPAQVVEMQGFSSSANDSVKTALAALNTKSGKEVTTSGSGDGYQLQVTFRMSPIDTELELAGRSTFDGENCLIELSPTLFEKGHEVILEATVWHELGHCAGMDHVSQSGEIMSRSTNINPVFNSGAYDRFLKALVEITQL